MKKLSNKGFTLVELIIVIAILAIIMLIALPNVPQIIQRQRVKADIASAQKIAEYVRGWYSDYSLSQIESEKTAAAALDATKATITPASGSGEGATPASVTVIPVKYDSFVGIDTYIEKKYTPSSLLDENGVAETKQHFAVFLAGSASTAKIAVAILPEVSEGELGEGTYLLDENGNIKASYDGYVYDADEHEFSSSVAYIEG